MHKFKLDQKVKVKGLNKTGVIKEIDGNSKQKRYKVTHYTRTKPQRRITVWYYEEQLDLYFPIKQLVLGVLPYNEEVAGVHVKESILSRKDADLILKATDCSQFQMVRQFHKEFRHGAPDEVKEASEEAIVNRAGYLVEEIIELLHATSDDDMHFEKMMNTLSDRIEDSYVKQIKKKRPESKLIGQVDAYADILYFSNGGFCELSVVPDNIFKIVHAANMGKLFPDGKPHYNEYKKVIKPDNWEEEYAPEPKIKAELEHQEKLGKDRFSKIMENTY